MDWCKVVSASSNCTWKGNIWSWAWWCCFVLRWGTNKNHSYHLFKFSLLYTPNLPFLPIHYMYWHLGKIPTQTSWGKSQGCIKCIKLEGIWCYDVWVKAEQRKAGEIRVRWGFELKLPWCYFCLTGTAEFLGSFWLVTELHRYNSPTFVIGKVLKIGKYQAHLILLKLIIFWDNTV